MASQHTQYSLGRGRYDPSDSTDSLTLTPPTAVTDQAATTRPARAATNRRQHPASFEAFDSPMKPAVAVAAAHGTSGPRTTGNERLYEGEGKCCLGWECVALRFSESVDSQPVAGLYHHRSH